MTSVVFLRAVNVGGANRCQPALIAKQLAKFGVVNIGAVGTFVVREDVSESVMRAAIARKLPFKCEIMICPARDIIKLTSKDPFDGQPSGPNITRFVSVSVRPFRRGVRSALRQTSNLKPQTSQLGIRSDLHQTSTASPARTIKPQTSRIRSEPHQTSNLKHQTFELPLSLPSDDDWLLKIIAIEGRFVLGLYRRQMKAISYLSKIEKKFGVAVTTRNWNTIQKIVQILNET
jgi:uncharacterized protein (DUF1697 family)